MDRYPFILTICLLLNISQGMAQSVSETHVLGLYFLEDIMETSAGIKIDADHTFEYKFSYGAAEKWGKGTWILSNNRLILKSDHKQPEKDFVMTLADTSNTDGLMVKIVDSLGNPFQYIDCRFGGVSGLVATTNENGEVIFQDQKSRVLEMMNPVYSTRISSFELDPNNTYFIFRPTCDLSEVYFENFPVVVSFDVLMVGRLPGLPAEDLNKIRSYKFKRVNSGIYR